MMVSCVVVATSAYLCIVYKLNEGLLLLVGQKECSHVQLDEVEAFGLRVILSISRDSRKQV